MRRSEPERSEGTWKLAWRHGSRDCAPSRSGSGYPGAELSRYDLGFDRPPFVWDEERRAWLRAELDAWYARAYGLTRGELCYILDPADVMGPEYPSETFRVLKTNECRRYAEYRTQRLVLQAWDEQEVSARAERSSEFLSDGAWSRPSTGTVGDATLPALAALIKRVARPTSAARARLAAVFILEPQFLTRRLSKADADEWTRLVGPEAALRPQNVVAFSAPNQTRY